MIAGTDIKTAAERIESYPDRSAAEFLDSAKDAEIADLRAALEAAEQKLAQPQEPFNHYGMSPEQVQQLLGGSLKPEEISGADDVQHDRVHELVRWFARLTQGNANSKWAVRHACELAYFIATNGINRYIDLNAIRDAAFKEGVNITPQERGTLERIGFATPRPPQPDSERDAALLTALKRAREFIAADAVPVGAKGASQSAHLAREFVEFLDATMAVQQGEEQPLPGDKP